MKRPVSTIQPPPPSFICHIWLRKELCNILFRPQALLKQHQETGSGSIFHQIFTCFPSHVWHLAFSLPITSLFVLHSFPPNPLLMTFLIARFARLQVQYPSPTSASLFSSRAVSPHVQRLSLAITLNMFLLLLFSILVLLYDLGTKSQIFSVPKLYFDCSLQPKCSCCTLHQLLYYLTNEKK